jgi:hypothetical protein
VILFHRPGTALYWRRARRGPRHGPGNPCTFHERAGEQFLVNGYGINLNGWLLATWARGFNHPIRLVRHGCHRASTARKRLSGGFDVFAESSPATAIMSASSRGIRTPRAMSMGN